ncbi:class I SAM-dependent methyltransferase [Maribacter sp. 2-571]|uniref:class I SAM-dependent methyltransferase n=1 Tax=Maribacter sp. 2-571 TaxID=3417569 RepID=UPI003D34F03B
MKASFDLFSEQAESYKKFRPSYPKELYQEIIGHVNQTAQCWDCGTGNGQVALALAPYFDKVMATDISSSQLAQAPVHEAISYSVSGAEHTSFADNSFDLITVAQALHWFDFDAFNREVFRVSKNNGVLAVWGYGLLRIAPALDEHIDSFYSQVIGPYWNARRKHVDTAYAHIPLDFQQIVSKESHFIQVRWNLKHFVGYLNSWSSVQTYRKKHPGKDPVKAFVSQIAPLWKIEEQKDIRFPIFLKMGRIKK